MNGDKYTGEWANDMKNGKGNIQRKTLGILHYSNGCRYDGLWKDDEKAGGNYAS